MNAVNQMPYMLTGMETAFPNQTQPQTAQGTEPNKFESVLREKHQESTGQTGRKETKDSTGSQESEPVKAEQEVPEERYVLAAAMMMQPRPEIVNVQPEQTAEEVQLSTEALSGTTEEQLPTMETLPEAAQETVIQETDLTPQAGSGPEEATVPVNRETPELKADAEKPQETERTETFQPVQTQDTSEKPQAKEQPEAKLDARPQTRRAERPEEDLEDSVERSGAWSEPVFGQLNAAPVKVAAPEKPVNMQAPDAADQLAERLTDAAEKGLEQIQIRLAPEGLGEVNVTISRTENGALSIVLRAVDPKAVNLLMQHTNDLQNNMANAVRGEVQIEVREPESSQQQQLLNPDGQQNREQREQQGQRQERQKNESDEFIQKLRLGLTDLTQAV